MMVLVTNRRKKVSETFMTKQFLLNQNNSIISKKEVFGPVVCIYSYDDIDEAIQKANSTRFLFKRQFFK